MSVKELLNGLESFKTRAKSRKALIEMDPAKAGAEVLAYAQDNELNDNVGWAIASVLGEWKYKESIPYLINLLNNHCLYGFDVMDALGQITGDEFGNDSTSWLRKYDPDFDESKLVPESILGEEKSEWDQIIEYFGEDVRKAKFEGNVGNISLKTPGDRKHQVLLMPEGEPWHSLRIYTVCGEITDDKIKAVQKYADALDHCELKIEEDEDGSKKGTLDVTIPIGAFDCEEVCKRIRAIAIEGDNLEDQLTGQDII